jgi:hypothetical protein
MTSEFAGHESAPATDGDVLPVVSITGVSIAAAMGLRGAGEDGCRGCGGAAHQYGPPGDFGRGQ